MKKTVGIMISSLMLFTNLSSVSAIENAASGNENVKTSSIRKFIKIKKPSETETVTTQIKVPVTETVTETTTLRVVVPITETAAETTTQQVVVPVTETVTETTTRQVIAPTAEASSEVTTQQSTISPVTETVTQQNVTAASVKDIVFDKNTNLFSVPEGYYISDNMRAHLDRLNKNLKTKIVIQVDSIKRSVTAADIASFTNINTGAIDYNKVWSYCGRLMDTYNTAPYSRKFKTHDGVIVNVPVGDYGWKVDMTGLTQNVYQSLINFKDNVFSYKSSKSAFAGAKTIYGNDIGGTYIEVDLTNQNVHWFKDGVCVLSDYCVTGKKSTPTPAGTWSLKCNVGSKTRLTGPSWDVMVNYWAHFSQGCGFHDATWQPSLGLARWKAGYGSHGCVNLSSATAKRAFNIMQIGEPVVVYYR